MTLAHIVSCHPEFTETSEEYAVQDEPRAQLQTIRACPRISSQNSSEELISTELVPWRPFGELSSFRREMDDFWNRFSGEIRLPRLVSREWLPSVDISETKDKLLIAVNTFITITKNSRARRSEVMDRYVCSVCGYVYDPAEGDPENGIEPETKFEDLPDDWTCPVCGAEKDQFEKE